MGGVSDTNNVRLLVDRLISVLCRYGDAAMQFAGAVIHRDRTRRRFTTCSCTTVTTDHQSTLDPLVGVAGQSTK